MDKSARLRFFAVLRQQNPSPQTELVYENHYQLLVAVVLSAQATDISVNAATRKLFVKVKTPADMLRLGEEELILHIRTIGLFRSKARHVIALSQLLIDKHSGEVPNTRPELQLLPGVGRKTANVILNTAFGQPTIAVDTHIFRVSNRTGLAPGKNVDAVEENLLSRVPKQYLQDAHHWLILHGRYVCKARKPLCGSCPVAKWCGFGDKDFYS
ncbi:MAG: endonuclease III [Gammaproteobacteria bacterium WSBS_2016_MAG_OTU1]